MLHRRDDGRAAEGGAPDARDRAPGSRDPWAAVRVRHLGVCPFSMRAPRSVRMEAAVDLGRLAPADVRVDLEPEVDGRPLSDAVWPRPMHSTRSYRNGTFVFEARIPWPCPDELDALTVRVRPKHARATDAGSVSRSFPRAVLDAARESRAADGSAGSSRLTRATDPVIHAQAVEHAPRAARRARVFATPYDRRHTDSEPMIEHATEARGHARPTSGPALRPRPSGVHKREPFADDVPRPLKRTAGRLPAPATPAHVRVFALTLDDEDRRYVRERLGMRLGKFARSIERVSVRLDDVNGPRGGVDQRCRIKVVLSRLPSIACETHATRWRDAFNGAIDDAERAVRKALQRRRTKPITAATRERAGRGM